MTTTLYIAGPMTGLPENNYPAFNAAEAQLHAAGYDTLNPATSNLEETAPYDYVDETTTWDAYMRNGINQLIRADGVALLPGWENSRGARLELYIAAELGMRAQRVDNWLHAAREGHDHTSLVHIEP